MIVIDYDADIAKVIEITLKSEKYKGQKFVGEMMTCTDPFCDCGGTTLFLKKEGVSLLTDENNLFLAAINVDSEEFETISERIKTDEPFDEKVLAQSTDFQEALKAEMDEDDWGNLQELYYYLKETIVEEANVDELEVEFDEDFARAPEDMMAYDEIFPCAHVFNFEYKGEEYEATDRYCVNDLCECTEIGLQFSEGTLVRYDYETKKITLLSGNQSNAQAFVAVLKKEYPDFKEELLHRRKNIKTLFKKFRLKNNIELPAKQQVTTKKVDRNAPCPCGSGKKYKKCCGAGK